MRPVFPRSDFGAGFASLRHVLLLQPDVVKLDTSLTRDVHDSPRQQAIVQALVTFSTEVGAVVLARRRSGLDDPRELSVADLMRSGDKGTLGDAERGGLQEAAGPGSH